jgi:SAM domain (Sterile alpha motif)
MSWTRSFIGIMIDDNPSGSIMDVGDWLRSLGLTQYEDLFRENDIDTEVLVELTESDLTGLGVSLGHRKRLLKAIAKPGASLPPKHPRTPQSAVNSR